MEQAPPSIWSRLLTKRQRSPPSSFSDPLKTSAFLGDQSKNFFFTKNSDDSLPVDSEPQKKVKLERDFSGPTLLDSPSTRIDENSPNMNSCVSPQIKFNEVILGSPARYDLERYFLKIFAIFAIFRDFCHFCDFWEFFRDSFAELEEEQFDTTKRKDSSKGFDEINREITDIMKKNMGKVMVEKEIYHETYFFLAQ